MFHHNLTSKLRDTLSQAYFLGGSPCSGKSTIAEALISQFGFQYYKVDDHDRAHLARCRPDRHPTMTRIKGMSWNQIWSRPVPVLVADELAYYQEEFEMILADLEAFAPHPPVLLEGAALLPELIAGLPVDPKRILYLVPTEPFQLHHYSQRPWIQHILKDCDDPDQAFRNWMQRDHQFGQEIFRQAESRGFRTIVVDGEMNLNEMVEQVSIFFNLVQPG